MNNLIAAECRHLQAYLLISDNLLYLRRSCLLEENDLLQGLRNDARHDHVLTSDMRQASMQAVYVQQLHGI